jgi:hypothetical protein
MFAVARGNGFTGKIKWVQIDIDAAAKAADHMIGADTSWVEPSPRSCSM